jgi:hypothetical protein
LGRRNIAGGECPEVAIDDTGPYEGLFLSSAPTKIVHRQMVPWFTGVSHPEDPLAFAVARLIADLCLRVSGQSDFLLDLLPDVG